MSNLEILVNSNENTVVAEYISEEKRNIDFQSEDILEKEFIKKLCEQGYEYINIETEQDLINNLRSQLEKLNNFTFFDKEWNDFYSSIISNGNDGILEKTQKIQNDEIQLLVMDNGYTKNIKLIDKKNIHNNHMQIINQYVEDNGLYKSRYDVTILVNGLPMIHIELKRRGIPIREAFNQIKRYQRESFWASCGLFQFIQLFVISNGTHTKYYSNTTRENHLKDNLEKNLTKKKQTGNSFEFTSFWADAQNKPIQDIIDFTKTFFAKHTILNILTKYCVFTSENLLLVMRPYQIVATERIINKIEVSKNNPKILGKIGSGGYIWHTTGSGKTLTSFKTAQIISKFKYIDKVLFVVDRKDLDYQTMKEYDRFERGAANSNTSTKILQSQLEDFNTKIIITTIQKLGKFVSKNKKHDIYNKHVVIIFDECHRSQFGEMHNSITKAFKKYNLFGFTGTPIFAINSIDTKYSNLKTTAQIFGGENDVNGKNIKALHTYTIVDAIRDENVLPFRIDYIDTIDKKSLIFDKKIKAIDREKALFDPKRIRMITNYILTHFDQKTYRNQNNSYFEHKIITNIDKITKSKVNMINEEKKIIRVNGFNSIFAVASIPAAIAYYKEFKKQMKETNRKLNIATIFSFNPNDEDPEDIFQDETFEVNGLDQTSRDFLEEAIKDYNEIFRVNYDTTTEKFSNYYKDISLRMKNREIDLLIVVNMFLTGFDSTTLNTLWVDKSLKQHGLIQAFSRTNRILNSVKTFGNIVCFRPLEQNTNDALSLFGNSQSTGIVILKKYDEYINGYIDDDKKYHIGYKQLIERIKEEYPVNEMIIGEEREKKFIQLFSSILKIKNILNCFDDFKFSEFIAKRDFQDYQSKYIDLYQEYSKKNMNEKERINDDIIFEIELIKQVEVNIDFILKLAVAYHDKNCNDKEILLSIDKAINSSIALRSKKELIEIFIKQMTTKTEIEKEWYKFIEKQKNEDLNIIINDENLRLEETKKFILNSFRDGEIKTTGVDIDKILPPVSRFSKSVNRAEKKKVVIDKLKDFFYKYFGVI